MTVIELIHTLLDRVPSSGHKTVMIAASSDDIHEHVTDNISVEFDYEDHIIIRSED